MKIGKPIDVVTLNYCLPPILRNTFYWFLVTSTFDRSGSTTIAATIVITTPVWTGVRIASYNASIREHTWAMPFSKISRIVQTLGIK
jgi:hypothetical protein